MPERRGSYAKGIAKREEILARALDVVAREGYRGASVKEIAEAVGLSQAGLLHYFGSKEELFTEILRARDEVDSHRFGPVDFTAATAIDFAEFRSAYLRLIDHNSEVPGLVQLFSRLAVDAADPGHPAHGYFVGRGASMRELLGAALERAQAEGRISDRADPVTLTRILQAVADGMQLQWMLDPDIDMAATVDALFDLLITPALTATGTEPVG